MTNVAGAAIDAQADSRDSRSAGELVLRKEQAVDEDAVINRNKLDASIGPPGMPLA